MSGLRVGIAAVTIAVLVACTSETPDPDPTPPSSSAPTESSSPDAPPEFDADRVLADVRHLAREIGARPGTSDAFAEAADWVEQRFTELGYDVVRQEVDVPAGTSWGRPVPAGKTPNVIASPSGFDDEAPHRLIGAHLDTVPQAPGAEDNASGVAVMLEVARVYAGSGRPVRFVAFTSEEPRGPGDDLHHFGSRAYVSRLDRPERDAVQAMVSLDRVGVRGSAVPLCTGGKGTTRIRDQIADAARDADVPTRLCADNRASDHWSFERNGLRAARIGSIPYAGYHSAGDLPRFVDRRQVDRVGAILTTWLDGAV
jgi:hypothetical protein